MTYAAVATDGAAAAAAVARAEAERLAAATAVAAQIEAEEQAAAATAKIAKAAAKASRAAARTATKRNRAVKRGRPVDPEPEVVAEDNGVAPAVFKTSSIPAMVFALAGAVRLSTADTTVHATDLLHMLNANRASDSPALTELPGLLELFDILRVPIALTGKDGITSRFPPTIADESRRLTLSHNGRGMRIGSTLQTVNDPSWASLSTRDEHAGAHIALATIGFRRFGDWQCPRIRDIDRNLGAWGGKRARSTDPQSESVATDGAAVAAAGAVEAQAEAERVAAATVAAAARAEAARLATAAQIEAEEGAAAAAATAKAAKAATQSHSHLKCSEYVQGPSNADCCVCCGRSSSEHKPLAEYDQLARQLQRIEEAMAAVKSTISTPSSPPSFASADLRAKLSPGTISNISSDRTTNAILAQPAQRLLSWSKFEYADWKSVRDAAKLAYATGTRDHQRFHLSEDMECVLSAYCDRYAGNLGDKSKKGQAFRNLNERPLDEWIKTVDEMMRKAFKVPEFDKLELDLLRDDNGRPALDAWRAAWIIFEQQENYQEEKDRLGLLRESVEKNFKEITAERLEPEYKRWRRDKTPLLEAIFAVCDLLEPYTSSSIKFGKARARPKDWKQFFCVNCKANDTHNSADCKKAPIEKKGVKKVVIKEVLSCFTCKATDHKTADCPKKPKDTCTLCKKPGHLAETCFFNPSYKPPAGYICKRCNKAGHFAQQCKDGKK